VTDDDKANETALKFITQEDQDKVNAFLKSFAMPFIGHYLDNSSLPSFLYHYTTGDSLIQIIESQELWATQAACLNDTTELIYAADLLRLRVKERIGGTVSKEFQTFLSHFAEVLLNPSSENAGIFVTCFSEKRDDLSQWRAYSGGEGGYAIQFDPIELARRASTIETLQILVRIVYKLENELVDTLLTFGEQCFVELQGASRAPTEAAWLAEFMPYWVDQIALLAPCFKHPKFEGEAEWRFLYRLRPEDVRDRRMKFRQRQYMMTRHIPLLLPTPLPITGVLVGPCRHPQLSRIAVGDLLKKHDYDPDVVKVELTDVPYRAA